ncbi:MAG: hypothetical protein DME57_11245 [Verrucomicrobia bacterium]|nr:MAG: hypothetical protein DME57_11245 [Verrucomicrobiota bacterium]
MRTAIRILVGIVGAIAGTLIGAIFGLFVATLFGGGNDLAVAFLIMPTVPSGAILGAVFGSIFALLFFHW